MGTRLKSTVLAVLLAGVMLGATGTPGLNVRFFKEPPLRAVDSWEYWLQDYDLERLDSAPVDMLVIAPTRVDPKGGAVIPFSVDDVRRLRSRPDGSRRLVLAHLSIGQADEQSSSWKSEWKTAPPSWSIAENCRAPRKHLVRFWDEGWKDIVFKGPSSMLARLQEAGFDGVYVDRVDVYDDIKDRHADARERMIGFVRELAATARARNRRFLIVAQNAEDLLSDAGYREAVDGIAKEGLLHGVDGTGKRNPAELVAWSVGQIQKLQRQNKTAFAVEYLKDPLQASAARAELGRLAIVPVFAPRALDGTDPLRRDGANPAVASKPAFASKTAGATDHGSRACNGVWHAR